MTRADLLALAVRVEAADAADRALDAEIVWRTTPGIVGIERGPMDDSEDDFLFEWWPRRPWAASWLTVPAFTASIDAAASLARKSSGFIAAMGDIAADGLPGVCLCIGTDPLKHVWGVSTGGGPDPDGKLARAMTAAALRVLAEETPQ
jgi:hypothetical protein